MNIYLFFYILLIIILFFIIINLCLSKTYKQNIKNSLYSVNQKNLNNILEKFEKFEKFENLDDIIIPDSTFASVDSGTFPDGEDPGQAISDLSIPDMQNMFEETVNDIINNNDANDSNAQRPPVLLSLSSARQSSSKELSAITQLYDAERIQQSITAIDTSNLVPPIPRFIPQEEYKKPVIPIIIQEEDCCKPHPSTLHDPICGDHYDVCRVDEEGYESCCDGYTCLRPNGNFGYKKCLNDSDRGFNFKVPDVDTTGFYDLTIPKTDLSKLRIPSIDISGIKGFNISDIGANFAKFNPINSLTCSTDKYTYNKWTGEITENSSITSS